MKGKKKKKQKRHTLKNIIIYINTLMVHNNSPYVGIMGFLTELNTTMHLDFDDFLFSFSFRFCFGLS